MMIRITTLTVLSLAYVLHSPLYLFSQTASADGKDDVDAKTLLSEFSSDWDESKWEKQFRGTTYMRASSDDGWQARMKTLQALVNQGKDAVPALQEALTSKHVPTRILAAQALGYLAPYTDIEQLQTYFRSELDPAVRLYLADAIGMSGKGDTVDWSGLGRTERNRDVLKHLGYGKERGDSPVSDEIVRSLAEWDSSVFDSSVAEGDLAPDFTLTAVDGTEFKLSQFRGEKNVVLVFIYGDT